MLKKVFLQLRNVEIDWDLQVHIVHVRGLTLGEPEISLGCCFCRGEKGSACSDRHCLAFLPMFVFDLCASATPELALIKEEAEPSWDILPLKEM